MSMDTILALLAKVTSDNEHEAAQGLAAAVKRIEREGISILVSIKPHAFGGSSRQKAVSR